MPSLNELKQHAMIELPTIIFLDSKNEVSFYLGLWEYRYFSNRPTITFKYSDNQDEYKLNQEQKKIMRKIIDLCTEWNDGELDYEIFKQKYKELEDVARNI